MAQTGFMLSDEGRSISVTNDSATTAIIAGDICYVAAANDDVLTGTAASARNAYGVGDILVKSLLHGTATGAGYKTVLGVAIDDIPAAGVGSLAMEGVFIHPVAENVEAGNCVQASEVEGAGKNELQLADGGTTAGYEGFATKIGRALTGGSADGKYIVWKLAL